MQRTITFAIAALASIAVADTTAEACSCMPPSIETSFETSTDVVGVRIEGRRRIDGELIYAARVIGKSKGCTERGQRILLATPESSDACGVTTLRPGQGYLIFGDEAEEWRGRTVLDIGLCDYNKPVRDLTRADWRFLRANAEECDAGGPTCDEYGVAEFGMCDMVLGVGIQAETGTCGTISGCGLPDNVELFETLEECQSACMED